jgi:hypothetical protein
MALHTGKPELVILHLDQADGHTDVASGNRMPKQ